MHNCVLFDTPETAVTLTRRAATSTGLITTVNVIRRVYQTGRNATEQLKQNMSILFDNPLPNWNYRLHSRNVTLALSPELSRVGDIFDGPSLVEYGRHGCRFEWCECWRVPAFPAVLEYPRRRQADAWQSCVEACEG